jgi:hypothetical protein
LKEIMVLNKMTLYMLQWLSSKTPLTQMYTLL